MRKLLLLALLLLATPAAAQNCTCPTRPAGDSTNACASTAFVQNAFGSTTPTFPGQTGYVFANNGAAPTASTTIPASVLVGTTLPSSIQNFGTILTGVWNASPISNGYLAPMVTGTVKANMTAGTAAPSDLPPSIIFDAVFGSTQGSVLCRGPSLWQVIPPGTLNQALTITTAGACPTWITPAGSQPRSAVRQTVQGGPQSSGAPNFLPSTSATLSLTAQNVSTGANALTIAAAQGYNSSGQNDVITQLTSNPTWSGLASGTTNYLYINASTGATGSSTLQPIYQFGGTIATTSGQFTFDYAAMIGYIGNGSAAVATPLVFVGEAATSSSGVTSSIAYAYNGYYDSGYTGTFGAPASLVTIQHNLGIADYILTFSAKNLIAEGGYTVGQIITGISANNTQEMPVTFALARTSATLRTGSSNGGSFSFAAINGTTGAAQSLTNANWAPRYVVRRGWGRS